MWKRGKILSLTLSCILALSFSGCSSSEVYEEKKETMSYKDATEEMSALLSKVNYQTISKPVMDIYSDEVTEADALADINTFPIMVKGTGDIDIEIAAATEMSSDAPDDWMNIVAKNFNKEKYRIGDQTVSVSIRKITSGEVVTYINAGIYQPEVYVPSNYAWGEMLEASGIGIEKIEDRIAGNTAGLLIKKDVYDTFIEKYKEPTVSNVLDATINGDLLFAYTNPYTSSTGLNILTAMLKSFDESDPLSENASQKLLAYQKSSPPVAYTTAVLRNSAAKGIINAMVMEEQAYVNTPELSGYVYIPAGIRHDHPVYIFDWDTEQEKEAAKMFTEYCKNEESQKLASEKGFNRHDDYKGQDSGLTGTGYLNAQKIWKQNKNGGKPIIAVFVSDISGSMDGEPIKSLKKSLISSSSYIGSEHYIGLVSYNSKVMINLPIAEFDATQRAYFSGEVKNLSANGGTATYDATLVGINMLLEKSKELPEAKLMMFVLTDGEQNTGYPLSRIKDIVSALQIPVYTIAYNYSNTDELETLSELNEAVCIKADSDNVVNQLRNLFQSEV